MKINIRKKISLIVGTFSVSVLIVLIMVFSKFSKIDGYSNAINKAGSQRMRTILLGSLANSYIEALKSNNLYLVDRYKKDIESNIAVYDNILKALLEGDDSLGLSITTNSIIVGSIQIWEKDWINYKKDLKLLLKHRVYTERMEYFNKRLSVDNSIALKDKAHKVVLEYTSTSNREYLQIKLYLFLIILFVIIFSLITIAVIIKNLKPITNLVDGLDLLSKGNLTNVLDLKSSDEIGQISDSINNLSTTYKVLLTNIFESTKRVKSSNSEINNSSSSTKASVSEIIECISFMDDRLEVQSKAISNSSSSVSNLVKNIDGIVENLKIQSDSIASNSASVEEMVSSIESVSKNTEKANIISTQLLRTATTGGREINRALLSINEIHEQSKKINSAVFGISKIAAKTNLLSMNASIEAAHAGEAGKGFSVVANEIGTLAKSVSRETTNINQLVDTSNKKINTSIELAKAAEKAFVSILGDIKISATLSNEIATSLEEQTIASRELLYNIEDLVGISNSVKHILKEINTETLNVDRAVTDLDLVKRDFSKISSNFSSKGSLIEESVRILSGVVEKNNDVIKKLENSISTFII